MWPSEGSVCQALIPLLAEHGIEWIATDEEILGCSTGGRVGRDSRGHVRHPELLYRAWKVQEAGHELAIVFRDHSMSDQVGFHYQRSPGPVAAADFMGKVAAIGDACRHNPATLVPVILDGENCWEYYPDGGVSFLRSLYQNAARDPRIRPVKIGEFLREHPPADTLHHLFAGSWISHNFAIWIGHPEDNQAWDALHAARTFLVEEERVRQARSGRAGESLGRALYRPGLRLVLVVRRRPFERSRRTFRPPVPQTRAQYLHASGLLTPPAGCSRRSRERAAIVRFTTSRSVFRTSRSMDAPPTLSGSTRRVMSAATIAGR